VAEELRSGLQSRVPGCKSRRRLLDAASASLAWARPREAGRAFHTPMVGTRHGIVAVALVAGAVGASAGAPASAHPPAPVGPGGAAIGGKLHGWLHQSRTPLVRGRIQIVRARCPARTRFVACVYSAHPRRIYIRAGLHDARYVLYHELGHVFDLRVLNDQERRAFRRIMRLGKRRWWRGRQPPAELFAEGYADCARFGRLRSARRSSVYGYAPTRAQHRAVCRLIERAAAPGGRRPRPPRKPPRVIGPEHPPPAPAAPERPQEQRPAPGDGSPSLLDLLLRPEGVAV
jgi:hypothetical protein